MKTSFAAMGILISAVFLLAACGDKSTESVNPDGPALGESFTILEGDTVAIAGTAHHFAFLATIWDTRCPRTEVCNWPGYVDIVGLWIDDQSGSTIDMRLMLTGDGSAASIEEHKYQKGGYTFRLFDMSPYPLTSGQSQETRYTAVISVSAGETETALNGRVKLGGMPESNGHGLSDPPYFRNARVVGDTLEVVLISPFNSDRDVVYAYMQPADFAATWPPTADIYFRRVDQSGVGDAFDTIPARFSLASVRDLYREQFGGDGPMMLNLHTHSRENRIAYEGSQFVRARLLYDRTTQAPNWPPVIIEPSAEALTLKYPDYIFIHAYDPNGTVPEITVDGLPAFWSFERDYYFPDAIVAKTLPQAPAELRIRVIASDGALADTLFLDVRIVE